ncbi:MAG: glycosyltransferase family 2 protein [Clostridium sp.]|uniref:glycosyltransferase family 2 protein n=1 Tax=Clostridium sp. TaxID=1506 RepID=UPI0029130D9B|nr:glycosyltransferase family 2 protein [Clostridium sp.]MDU4937967.1 glycosyltransferase family 2 protein [Clostridium sp.]
MGDLISIIIPVYNVRNYIEKCLYSVINQTYSNIEIIIVDDGSTDGSSEVCDEIASKDNRIKVIHKENGGLSDARNKGIENANGEYILFLDSDDWVKKSWCERMYELLKENDADISVCNYYKVISEEEILENDEIKIKHMDNIEALNNIYTEDNVQYILAWNKLYKKSLFKELRYPFGKVHEDEFLTPEILYLSEKVVVTNEKLMYYRQTPGSIMNREFNIKRLDYIEALEKRTEFFREKKLKELESKNLKLTIQHILNFVIKIEDSNIWNKGDIVRKLYKRIDLANPKELDIKTLIKLITLKVSKKIYKNLFY